MTTWVKLSMVIASLGGLAGGGYFIGSSFLGIDRLEKNEIESVPKNSSVSHVNSTDHEKEKNNPSNDGMNSNQDNSPAGSDGGELDSSSSHSTTDSASDVSGSQDSPGERLSDQVLSNVQGHNEQASDKSLLKSEDEPEAKDPSASSVVSTSESVPQNIEVRTYDLVFVSQDLSSTVELVFKESNIKGSCKKWVEGKQQDMLESECEKIFEEKGWKDDSGKQPDIWLRAQDQNSIQKSFLEFFNYSENTGNFSLEEKQWEENSRGEDYTCSFFRKGSAEDKKVFEVGCSKKKENSLSLKRD